MMENPLPTFPGERIVARSDSTAFAVDAAKALAKPLPEPTQPLDERALAYWPAIIQAKRLNAWTGVDLALATALARDLGAIETLSEELERDGHTLTDGKGKRYAHPAANLLDQAMRRTVLTTRSLQIHAIATTGKTDHQGKKNQAARELAGKLDNVHDLIPRARTA
jgi:hypothetical protein